MIYHNAAKIIFAFMSIFLARLGKAGYKRTSRGETLLNKPGMVPGLNVSERTKIMEKVPSYTAAQTALILSVAAANGGVLNLDLAKSIAANPAMNDADGKPRGYRNIVAKISTMVREGAEITYARKQPTTKTGGVPTKKSELVDRIAALAGVNAAKLDGMDKSPKQALETIVSAIAGIVADRDNLWAEVHADEIDGDDEAVAA